MGRKHNKSLLPVFRATPNYAGSGADIALLRSQNYLAIAMSTSAAAQLANSRCISG
jgi:hypothetical protein